MNIFYAGHCHRGSFVRIPVQAHLVLTDALETEASPARTDSPDRRDRQDPRDNPERPGRVVNPAHQARTDKQDNQVCNL